MKRSHSTATTTSVSERVWALVAERQEEEEESTTTTTTTRAVRLRLDLPFRKQTVELGASARYALAKGVHAVGLMENEWVRLIECKIKEIQALERRKHTSTEVPFDKRKFFFSPSECMGLCDKDDLIIRTLNEIRADARIKKTELPWPECLPFGIFTNDGLRAYTDAWRAELDAGAAAVDDDV